MNQIGKIAICLAAAFVIVYVPVKYFQHGTATKAELDQAVKERDAVRQSLDAANRTVESTNAQLNDRQNTLNDLQRTKQDLTTQVRQLAAKTQQLEAEKNQPAPPPVSQEERKTENKFVTCPWCGGDFKNKYVICKREHAIGCDGKGYCQCPDCQSKGNVSCSNCGGTGKVTILTTSGGGLRQSQGTHLETW